VVRAFYHNAQCRSITFFTFFELFLASVRLGSKDEGSGEENESDKCSHYFSASGVCEKR